MPDKRVLHVVNIYFVLPFFIGDQFLYFKERGYDMNVVCSESEYLADYAARQHFDYIETPILRSISIKEDLKSLLRICRFIRKKNIDIVVGHTPKGGLLSMLAAKLCGVRRRIYFRHGLVYETSTGFKRSLLKNIDRLVSACATDVICVSQSVLQRSIEDKLANVKKQRILGQYGTCNGIDTVNMFNPELVDRQRLSDLREKYGIGEDEFVIGYTGRLVRDKGIIELIKAFDLLKDRQNCRLLLVGMFEERDALPDDLKKRIMNDPDIIYTGFINGEMEYYYSMMDMYVLPSYREGFPTGVLEAQAMGLPVVTTRVTGCRDSILEGETGLFTSHDPEEIAGKIDDIRLNHRIDGKEGQAWVRENFDSRKIWKEIEKLYQE